VFSVADMTMKLQTTMGLRRNAREIWGSLGFAASQNPTAKFPMQFSTYYKHSWTKSCSTTPSKSGMGYPSRPLPTSQRSSLIGQSESWICPTQKLFSVASYGETDCAIVFSVPDIPTKLLTTMCPRCNTREIWSSEVWPLSAQANFSEGPFEADFGILELKEAQFTWLNRVWAIIWVQCQLFCEAR
jgi:hypothetical protein